jgi:GNAT superfamily N-acetyltransferase
VLESAGRGFATRALSDADAEALQALLVRCADYFNVVMAREPGPADALAVFYAGPEEGQAPDNKILLGITPPNASTLIGVLDAFRNYPSDQVWYIGLLLLDPAARRGGLGAQILDELEQTAALAGARELQLNVVEQNKLGYAFWSRQGFVESRRWVQRFGERESVFIRMSKQLSRT